MKKRGRPSVGDLTSTRSAFVMPTLQPPADLSATEAQVFREIAASVPATHFRQSDAPLLAAYATAIVVSRRSAKSLEHDASFITVWEKSTRLVATLATKLRLAPQSRLDAKAVSRQGAGFQPSAYDTRPWER
jgi:hypothetical protein